MTKTMMMASLTLALFACSGEDDEPPAGPAPSGDAEFAVSCQGDVTKSSSVGLRCMGGEPGTRCGEGDPCAAQAIEVRYEPPAARCGSTNVYAWDGTACKAYATIDQGGAMRCKGADCEHLFKTEDACKQAHQSCGAE